jgi:hypothetical protein
MVTGGNVSIERHLRVSYSDIPSLDAALSWTVQQLDGELKGASMVKIINFQLNNPAMCTLPPGIHMVHLDRRGRYDMAFTHDQVVEREATDG